MHPRLDHPHHHLLKTGNRLSAAVLLALLCTPALALVPSSTAIISHSPTATAPFDAYTVQVSVSGSGGMPTGTVLVTDGANTDGTGSRCSISLSAGTGSCSLASRTSGKRSLSASYSGDSTFASSASSLVSHPVQVLQLQPPRQSEIVEGRPYAMRVALDVARPGIDPVPTGSINISDGTASCSIVLPTTAPLACSMVFTTAGAKIVTASYSGDANYPSLTSNGVSTWIRNSTNIDLISTSNQPRAIVRVEGHTVNSISSAPESLSADGRFAVFSFSSGPTNPSLASSDTNHLTDVHIFDRISGAVRVVSAPAGGLSQSNGISSLGVISADGRYVAFFSHASNLVSGDSNGVGDVFRWDRMTGTIAFVSSNASGALGNGASSFPSISGDGRHIAFHSSGNNLVSGDTNGVSDVFVKDMITGTVTRISVSTAGVQGDQGSYEPSISHDGKRIAFLSDANNLGGGLSGTLDAFVRDLNNSITDPISVDSAGVSGNSDTVVVRMAGDGSRVAMASYATNLVATDTNGAIDLFVHTLATGITDRVNVSSSGVQANASAGRFSISGSGKKILFESDATNLAADSNLVSDAFLRDTDTATTQIVSRSSTGAQLTRPSRNSALSSNGNFAAFATDSGAVVSEDEYGELDLFVRDLVNSRNDMVSTDYMANESTFDSFAGDLSTTGQYATFHSYANNLVANDNNALYDLRADVFVMDRLTRRVKRVSLSNTGAEVSGSHANPVISGNGERIAFHSDGSGFGASDLNGSTDVYLRDQTSATTTLISRTSSGNAGNSSSIFPSMDDAGDSIAFESYATDLIASDSNSVADIFVWDRLGPTVKRISVDSSGAQSNGTSSTAKITRNGRYVAFLSEASNLVGSDGNGLRDGFLHDRASGTTIRTSSTLAGTDGNGPTLASVSSDNGQVIAFVSQSSNLVAGDSNGFADVFVRDFTAGTLVRVNLGAGAVPANAPAAGVSISTNGRHIAFSTAASNLVSGDGNGLADVFVYDRTTGVMSRIYSNDFVGVPTHPNRSSANPVLSPDGSTVLFESAASDLEIGDSNGWSDVFASPVP